MIDASPDIAASISRIAVTLLPILLGMVLHELAHGYVAYRLGDPTPRLQGRLTLNPLKHLDVTGTLVFLVTALTSPFIFGWAKPVNIHPGHFKNPRHGMMLTSLAGPATNFILALLFGGLFALLLRMVLHGSGDITPTMRFFLQTANAGIWINLTLCWFNLLPIPSLDGGHILAGLMPISLAEKFYALGKYGLIVIVLLMVSGGFRLIMQPLVGISISFIGSIFSIPPRLLFL